MEEVGYKPKIIKNKSPWTLKSFEYDVEEDCFNYVLHNALNDEETKCKSSWGEAGEEGLRKVIEKTLKRLNKSDMSK